MPARVDLTPLLNPRSIAVIGASADDSRIGGAPIQLLRRSGFATLYAVNPKYDQIGDVPCFASIEEVPGIPDLAIIATSSRDVMDQLQRAHRKGVRAVILFASGFAETGKPENVAMQQAIVDFVAETGIIVNGPNCLGIVNWGKGVFATFARAFDPDLPAGSMALLGQSGNISSAIYRIARRMNVSFSHAINTGNEACLTVADFLYHLADDQDAKGALCYIEALRDGDSFLDAAKRMRDQGKLVAVFKAGASEKGAEAACSHTAALAGNRVAYEAALRSSGIALVQSLSHLADLAYMHRFADRKIGAAIGILSVSGAAGAIMADGLSAGNMTIPTLPDAVQAEIRKVLPAYGIVANPVDLTGNISNQTDNLGIVVQQILTADCIETVIMYLGDKSLNRGLPYLGEITAQSDKLVIVVDTFESGLRDKVEACGIAYFEDIDQAIRALTTYFAWQQNVPVTASPTAIDTEAVLSEYRRAIGEKTSPNFGEVASKMILAAGGIRVVRDRLVQTAQAAIDAAAQAGYPVVLKLASPDIAHKTEIGGVKLNLGNAAAVEQAYYDILRSAYRAVPEARLDGVVVEPFIEKGRELLLGAVRDPVFGWMMTVGLGGTSAELLGDVSHDLLPIDVRGAEAMLRRLKTFPLLDGYRGAEKADIAAVCRAMAALSSIVLCLGDCLSECEINPLLVLPEGQGVIAADALMILAASTG